MSDLILAQFCEQLNSELAKAKKSLLTKHRESTCTRLRTIPIHRATKSVLESIDIAGMQSQFSGKVTTPHYDRDPRVQYSTLPEQFDESFIATQEFSLSPQQLIADVLWNTGIVMTIPRGTVSEDPIQIPSLVTPGMWPLVRIIVEPECSIVLTENHDAVFSNNYVAAHLTEVIVQAGSSVRMLHTLERPSLQRILATTRVHLFQDSQFTHLTAVFGGNTGRVESHVFIHGSGVSLDQRIMHLTTDKEKLALVADITHAAPSSTSRLNIRGAIGGTSSVRTEGTIRIARGAQLTDAGLDEKTLFLSDTAKHDSVPGLQIDADDVKATHASAVSKVDPEAIFYCQSRGIEAEAAHALIIEGLLRSLTEGFSAASMDHIEQSLVHHLHATRR